MLLQAAIRAVWGILLVVPMPWRAAIVLELGIIGGYQLILHVLSLSLLPEFWITNRLRQLGFQPLPGTHTFGSFVVGAINASRRLALVATVIVGLGVCIWFIRPLLGDTIPGLYVDHGIALWNSFERWILLGDRAS